MVFYEAPHKRPSTLEDMRDAFGEDRPICLVRELTKIYEEIRHTTLGEAARYYRETPPRGEFVLVIHGANPPEEAPLTVEQAADLARDLMEEEGLSSSMAAKRVAAETGLKKGDIYRLLTEEN